MRFAKPSYQFVAFDLPASANSLVLRSDKTHVIFPNNMYIICEKSLQKFYFFINILDRW